MNLIFTGVVSSWVILLGFAAACIWTLVIYRRCRPSGPGSRILPALRIAALALLFACLWQPVISRLKTETFRGRIHVLVDNSGSMGIRDTWTLSEQVRIATSLGFPLGKRRCTAFEEMSERMREIGNTVDAARQSLESALSRKEPAEREQYWKQLRESVKAIRRSEEGERDRLNKEIAAFPYLQASEKSVDPTELGPIIEGVNQSMAKWKGLLDSLEKTLAASGSVDPGPDAAKRIGSDLEGIAGIVLNLKGIAQNGQPASDQILGKADIPEVRESLESFRDLRRIDICRHLLRKEPFRLLEKLQERGDVKLVTVDSPEQAIPVEMLDTLEADLPHTRLATAVTKTLHAGDRQPVAAVVVLSDGNNNSGKTIQEAKVAAEQAGIPVFCIGVGNERPPNDICIESILAPTSSFSKDRLAVSALIHRPGFEKVPLAATVKCGETILLEKVIPPGPETPIKVDLSFEEKEKGVRDYTVTVAVQEGEVLADNNTRDFSVNVIGDPIRTLLIDEFPRWESRYLNMMLKRDARVQAEILFLAGIDKDPERSVAFLAIFGDRAKLFAYDVLIIGDIDPVHFKPDHLENLRDFVLEKGGTCILLAGDQFMPVAYRETPLATLFPFACRPGALPSPLNETTEKPVADRKIRLRLTPTAVFDPLVQISDDLRDNPDLWNSLPGLNWICRGIYPSAHAEVMVETEDTHEPVIIKAYPGLGKILFVGADSFWRWRQKVRWKYHHRFWGQILLWATTSRIGGADPRIKLLLAKSTYAPDETIAARIRVIDDHGRILENGNVSAEIIDTSGKLVKSVKFHSVENSGGEYRAEIRDLAEGDYRIDPRVFELEGEIRSSLSFTVKTIASDEYIHLAMDAGALKQIGTDFRPFTSAADLPAAIRPVEKTITERIDYEIWDSWFLLLSVLLLLGIEWHLRKKHNLV